MFENDVNMYGIQTVNRFERMCSQFENDVNMYGIQTLILQVLLLLLFENDVKSMVLKIFDKIISFSIRIIGSDI